VSAIALALHGFLGCGRDWAAVRAATGGDVRWICPDLFAPGAGDLFTPPPLEGKAWLVGYSFGARLALRWLTGEPDRWHGALLLSVDPGNFQSEAGRRARRESDREWAVNFRRDPWDGLVARWNAQEVFAGHAHPRRDEGEFDREKLADAVEKFSVADQFTDTERLTGDFAWMAGEADGKFRGLLDEMRHTGFPGSFFVVPGAGHRLLHDAPEEVAARLGRLVAGRVP